MRKSLWLATACSLAVISPAFAQETAEPKAPDTGAEAAAPADEEEIVVTATRRASPLSDVPIAVSAITAASMQNSGASDIRQLNQISPSLLVSSTTSEAGAGTARIRGIGTVGDNAGLESSVAVFIDGVYRSRSGVGLTELGPVERVEVLRGPQGTLFGRNASAGLINVVTAKPQFENEGWAEASYGNYDYYRLGGGVTGPIGETIAYRLDGIWQKRDGFLTDVISGRKLNNRDRWLARGQLMYEPSDALSVLIIGDYAKRDEECCGASYLTFRNVSRDPSGNLVFSPSSIAAFERSLGAVITDDTDARTTSITPGHSYRSDVRDWGLSGEINYEFGGAKLTSITGYRDWRYLRGQDADFNNLDILFRADDGGNRTRFKTFTQELRLQGSAFEDKLDWLVGGYFADERLTLDDNLSFGADYGAYTTGLVRAASPLLASFPGFSLLNPFVQGFVNAQLAAAGVPVGSRPPIIAAVSGLVPNLNVSNNLTQDRFNQKSRNWALFTHNIFDVTDRVSLTLGARYTNEKKTLNADLQSGSQCGALLQSIANLRQLAATTPSLAAIAGGTATLLSQISAAPCVLNSITGSFSGGRKKEDEWSGTAVLSFKPTDDVMAYASYSKGYKAGGFNLDRAGLNASSATQDLNVLQFAPEKVDSYEIGLKYDGPGFDVNVAAFYQDFRNFQLNTFNGLNFVVENINACKDDLNGADADSSSVTGACAGGTKGGVISKGIEIEAFMRPSDTVSVSSGLTIADTEYRNNLVGTDGRPLTAALFQLPGRRLSNSAQYVVTGSAAWTPPLGGNGLNGLLYADFRYQSEINTGSDLDIEKEQTGVMVVNARAGITGADKRWSLEVWAQNLFDVDYKQVAFDAPIQGSGTQRATQAFGTTATQLYGAFLAEPRTYGVTVRTKF